MSLPTCCTDMVILLEHLIFPERMPVSGQEFVKAHGLDDATLAELRAGAIDHGGGLVKVFHRCQHLQDDGRCAIYDRRPTICRQFDCRLRQDCACEGKGVMP